MDIPETFEEHAKLMFDLMALALPCRCDARFHHDHGARTELAHVSEYWRARAASRRVASSQRSGSDREKSQDRRLSRVACWRISWRSCRTLPDGDGTLLDHSLILYGGGMGNGNLHEHIEPCLVAGGEAGGQVKPGRHIIYPDKTPMTNMLVTILDKVGVPIEKLGDSTGPLKPDYLTV